MGWWRGGKETLEAEMGIGWWGVTQVAGSGVGKRWLDSGVAIGWWEAGLGVWGSLLCLVLLPLCFVLL